MCLQYVVEKIFFLPDTVSVCLCVNELVNLNRTKDILELLLISALIAGGSCKLT